MHLHGMKSVTWALGGFLLAAAPVLMSAQASSKPATTAASYADSPSRWDIFMGYSYLGPHGDVNVLQPNGTTRTFSYDSADQGAIGSVAYYFNKYVGIQGEVAAHNLWVVSSSSNDGFLTSAGGLIFRLPTGSITPFVHGLVGGARIGGPDHEPYKEGIDLTGGGGLDFQTPWRPLAIRLAQADYEYMHDNWGSGVFGGRANINAARLSAGIVIHAGSFAPPPQLTVACAVNPTNVFPGDPVTATSTPGSEAPKENVVATISGDGINGAQTGTTATVNTGNLTPGTHTVKCDAKEGKPGKEGVKPWQNATESTATFTVKEFEPPTISCSANPTTLKPGDSSTITATSMSPQNRPLSYSYTATSGSVSGSGTTATYNSAGAPASSVDITCNVSDDKGHSASSTAKITIVAPPPPPEPPPALAARLALHSVFFPTNQPTAKDPTGGLVASQQGTLTALATDFKQYLQYKPDAHLILTGHTDVRGSVEFNQALSDRRVARAKQFLVEQGIPESSVETHGVGKEQELTAGQVKDLIQQNPDLSDAERARVERRLNVIVLAQNRRVDITLSTTGEQSVRQFPFNARDSLTLLDEASSAPRKKSKAKK